MFFVSETKECAIEQEIKEIVRKVRQLKVDQQNNTPDDASTQKVVRCSVIVLKVIFLKIIRQPFFKGGSMVVGKSSLKVIVPSSAFCSNITLFSR